MRSRLRTAALAGLLALVSPLATALTAQQVLDRGTLVIMQQGRLVGQEEFVVERGRRSGAPDGFTIASVVSYPAEQPTRRLTSVVEFGPDSQPAATLVEAQDGELRRVLIRLGPRRVTVRLVTPSGEAAREYPSAQRHLVLDDSLFAPHAVALPLPPGAGPPLSSPGSADTLIERVPIPLAPASSSTCHGQPAMPWQSLPVQS